MKRGVVHYFAEGDTEKAFLNSTMSSGLMEYGRVHVFNCWDGNIEKKIRTLPRSGISKAYIVFDTDITHRINDFVRTVAKIGQLSNRVILLQQTCNFEEELIFACSNVNSKNMLFKKFGASGAESFKGKFLKDGNRLVRLQSLGFDMSKMWSRDLNPLLINRFSSGKYIVGL